PVRPAALPPLSLHDALPIWLRSAGWDGPPVRVEIVKRIPVAAGMGGGSTDAAAMLRVARELAPLDPKLAAGLAAELGADVPSQLDRKSTRLNSSHLVISYAV